MLIEVYVSNQKLKVATNNKDFVSGTKNFVQFKFILGDDWDGLTTFSQFTQNNTAYNVYLDNNNCCYLPEEISEGDCTMLLYGAKTNVIATTNYLSFYVSDNGFISDAITTELTQSMYQQLVGMVSDKITDAPNDGRIYGRKNNSWNVISVNSGGSSNFNELNNRPSYNGSTMTNSTNIPEVKTETWDAKMSNPSGGSTGQVIKKTANGVEWANEKDSNIFCINILSYGETQEEEDIYSTDITVDKTLGEIMSAFNEGKLLMVRVNWEAEDVIGDAYSTYVSNGFFYFEVMSNGVEQYIGILISRNSNHIVFAETKNLTTLDREQIISSSSSEYSVPSSKAVYQYHDATKQDTISDLSTIRYGATLGATSLQTSQKGVSNGIAELDSNGKVPSSQLPSYVDDVLEYSSLSSFPSTGESGKIYIAQNTNKTYRWSGSTYTVISETLSLGETESTAYRGDRGAAAYTHISDTVKHIPSTSSASAGKVLKLNSSLTPVWDDDNNTITTASIIGSGNAVTSITASNGVLTVTKGTTFLTSHQDISGKENTSNKVTSISSSSTNTQYPSALAVYNAIQSSGGGSGSDKMNVSNPTGTGSLSINRRDSTTVGNYSVAVGYHTVASGYASHAEGELTDATGAYSHAEGYNTVASGYHAHTEGYYTTASEASSHAEGERTVASGMMSHAEGYATEASTYEAHAEGVYTIASGDASHAEGGITRASGDASHAEGYYTTASGDASHAEGNGTIASGNYSHAEGKGTIARGAYSHVSGKYNIADPDGIYAVIVGNGNGPYDSGSSARHNAYTLTFTGDGKYAGKLTVGSGPTNNMDVATKYYVDNAISTYIQSILYDGSVS